MSCGWKQRFMKSQKKEEKKEEVQNEIQLAGILTPIYVISLRISVKLI